jgi:hypothetical protein
VLLLPQVAEARGTGVKEGKLREFFDRIDRACARMNSGLAALAVALAVVVYATALVQAPNLITTKRGGHAHYSMSQLFGTDKRSSH